MRFLSVEDDYQQAVAEARRLTGASGRVAQADIPLVLDDTLARPIAETWLFETWAARERASFALPPSSLAIEPGDVVTVASGSRTRPLRIVDVSEHGVREIEARSIDADVYDRVALPSRTPPPKPQVQIGSPALAFMDLPLLPGQTSPEAGFIATAQVPWPGSVALYMSPQTSGYQLKALANTAAAMGVTETVLLPGPEGRLDYGARLRVKLIRGALASADLVTMLGGANAAAVRNASGAWEVIQYLNAELVGPLTYELSGLLRGQGGTEAAMASAVAAGASFVVLDGAVTTVPMSVSELNLPFNWRYGPGNRGIGDASYVTVQHSYRGAGLRPLSPTRVKATRSSGDLALSWIRRTRIGGDGWEISDVPLGETDERYEVDILSGSTVKRTLSTSTPAVTYTAAQQTADFGSVQAAVSVAVHQMSAIVGRGTARTAIV